ncbi:hypothetical protein THAOC_21783 [Thalassiosira oceanica]|uniref:Leucine-rich repeat domain-containing protein n=1 Tax=Thalassiosira oceanica TaxID=159749 RepID=K0RYM0_THAOC|nr:hypothetical protein THAOC_21783 [Thalassiosira oceanica]|eukprot:EJK58115.1 hypothetical protein THAOC_21783 [Thalassiosira oceanica]
MSAPAHKKAKISGGRLAETAATRPDVILLYEGEEVAEELRCEVTRVRIGPPVKRILNRAFRFSKLVVLQLNEGLLTIGEEAFQDCTALSSVNIPSTVTELGNGAFFRCSNLVDVKLNEGLQTIGENAFADCTALRSLYLPSTVKELGPHAFYGCTNLTKVLLNEGPQTIKEMTFERCTSLRSVSLPSTTIALDEQAFSECTNLASVKLNDGLQSIGNRAFEICTELRSVTIPSSVIRLGYRAFSDCRNIAEALLNEGLQSIGKRAFQNCSALQSVTIPSTVTEMGQSAFQDCSNLSEVIFLDGKWLLEQEFFARDLFSRERGLLNQGALDEILFNENRLFAFRGCPLATVKVSISWALSERMARLPPECRVSVENRVRNLVRLERMQDGNVLACFPLVTRRSDTEDGDIIKIQDTNLETARGVYQVLQLIAFHELKESSILIELALWKSRIGGDEARADCRVAIPGPAKSLIMEYCGFAGFLEPAIEGA